MTVRLNQVAAIVVIDRAGPRRSNPGKVPDDTTPIPSPAPSPALNPVENIRQFMRDNRRSIRIFKSHIADARKAFVAFFNVNGFKWNSRSTARSRKR